MIPASIRNNNPGAMYPGKSAKKFGSSTFETLKSKDGFRSKKDDYRHFRRLSQLWAGGWYAKPLEVAA